MGTSVAPALRYTSSDAFTAGAELAVPANSRSTKPTRNPLRADPPSQLNGRSDTVSSCPSGPCMAATTSAVSVAERAIAPTLSSVHRRVMQPYRLTRPYVGLSPATPHVDAGDTIDPFVSVPTANPTRPAAAAEAGPADEPLAPVSGFHGFLVRARNHRSPTASSPVDSLASRTAPASCSRVTAVAS